MNDLQKELQDLKAKVAELEARILFPAEPVKLWQPKGGAWHVDGDGEVAEFYTSDGSRLFGAERATKLQAERAAIEMRRFNRLLALRDELCGDDAVDWLSAKRTFYVYFAHEGNNWSYTTDVPKCESIMVYFTSEESAQRACDMLNSGEVEL